MILVGKQWKKPIHLLRRRENVWNNCRRGVLKGAKRGKKRGGRRKNLFVGSNH